MSSTEPASTEPPTPFVLGGPLRQPFRRESIRSLASISIVLTAVALPLRGLYRATGSSMEEGFMIVFPRMVQQGRVPNVDFLHLYGPTALDILALWYRIFGDSLESERTFGLLQHLGIIFGLYALGRAWGYVAATGSALVGTLLILTPIGLSALAWHGALALGLWAVVFANRARHTDGLTDWWWAGALAGLALGFRPDLVVAIGLALVVLVWRRREAAITVVVAAAVGLLPMWFHFARTGLGPAIDGMVIDPVVRLRPGRELPRPPSWGVVDGALQAVAEGLPPWWGVPAPSASQQLFLWFFSVIIVALVVPIAAAVMRRRGVGHGHTTMVLLSAGLFGLGILPQALQRPDSTHLAWVAIVSWALLVPTVVGLLGRRLAPPGASLVGTAAVLALMLVVCPFFTFRHYLLHTRVSAGQLPLPFLVERDHRKFWFGDFYVASAIDQMIPDLEARSQPGDRLLVGPADLSRTVYSDVSIYYLFPELTPATYYIEMDPGLADREDSGLSEDLATADFLVLTNIWTGWNEPNASGEHQSRSHNQAVANGFCLVGRYEDNLVLLFERCPGGGGIDPSEIAGRFPLPDVDAQGP